MATFRLRMRRPRILVMKRVAVWKLTTFLVLIGIGIVSRVLFQSSILHHWDSVNFALALDNFDLRLHQPHPPGMFILYIFLGRLFNFFLQNPNTSLVWISILATGLSVPIIFILGTTWFGRQVGLAISFLMLTSPLVWFHGEVALSYMPEFLWVLLIVYFCFKTGLGNKWTLYVATLLLGLAGGIRPNTPFFLFPLWAISVILGLRTKKYSLKHLSLAIILGIVGVLLWSVPLIVMSGGPTAFWESFESWRSQHVEDSASSEGIIVHTARLVIFTLYGVGIGLLPIIWILLRDWRVLKNSLLRGWPAQTIILWIVPALLYFTFIHIRQSGHIFTILPALIIIAGASMARVGQQLHRFNPNAWMIVTTFVVAVNGLFFLFGPANLFGSSRSIFSTPTWTTIKEYDAYVSYRLVAIRTNFLPEQTIVIAGGRNFRLPDFYLREFQDTSLSYRLRPNATVLPNRVNTLVLFDDTILPELATDVGVQIVSLPSGQSIRYITWNSDQEAVLSQTTFEIQDN